MQPQKSRYSDFARVRECICVEGVANCEMRYVAPDTICDNMQN